MSRLRIISVLLIAAVVVSACSFGKNDKVSEADAILTAAALTVQAQMAATATETPIPSPTPVTPTPEPSQTPTLLPTSTTGPVAQQPAASTCDNASFVSDVTVPDDSQFAPGETFTKTWRLQNAGTCTWTTDYEIVFYSDAQMDGPASQKLTASVAPGGTIDISVALTAPDTAGTYQGNWKLKNASGATFGINGNNAFWVKIKVSGTSSSTTTSGTNSITLTVQNSGSVVSTGSTNANAFVGDNADDNGSQAFVQFNISSIPDDATIDSATVNFGNYTLEGDPFGELGTLRVYTGSYFPLDSSSLDAGTGPLLRFDSSGDLSASIASEDIRAAIENALGNSTFELRFHFNNTETNSDGKADRVKLGAITITVEYTP
jgi:hypothetical protein